MSYSEVTTLKFVGFKSKQISSVVDRYLRCARSLNHCDLNSSDNWSSKDKIRMNFTLEGILNSWGNKEIIHASKFMDNLSVGGGQIHFTFQAFADLDFIEANLFSTDYYHVLFIRSLHETNFSLLKKLARNNIKSQGTSTSVLVSHIIDAFYIWPIISNYIILVIAKTLGPSIPDEEILELLE